MLKTMDYFKKNGNEKELNFATTSNSLIPISLEPDGVNLSYLKLYAFDLTEFIVWNIYDRQHWVAKI